METPVGTPGQAPETRHPGAGRSGTTERIALAAVDKERLMLEAFADGVAKKVPFLVPAEQAVNGIAVLEAIVASAASGSPVGR